MVVGKTLVGGDGAGARDRRARGAAAATWRSPTARRRRRHSASRRRSAAIRRCACAWRSSARASRRGPTSSGSPTDDTLSALRCTLHTGRTHQIRVHLASRGLPLVGDRALRRPAGAGHRRARRCMPPSWRSPIRCRDGRSPSPRPCRPTWRRPGRSSPDRRLEGRAAASLTITANRFDAIPPARRDPAAARAIDETHRDPIAPECASRRPASACAPDPPRSRRDDMPPGDAAEDHHDDMKTLDAKRVLETALICSSQPMSLRELRRAVRRRDRQRHPARAARRAGTRVRRQGRRPGRSWRAAGASRAGRRWPATWRA